MNNDTIKHIKNILFVIFTIIISSYILLELFMPDKTLDVFGFKSYIVVTSSMEPDIMINDMIIIHKVDEEDLEVRDVITFNVYIPELDRESEVTHYIGDIQTVGNETIYKTQGATKSPGDYDNWKNKANESIEITYDDIEGRVVFTIPYLGYVVRILRDPMSLGLIVVNVFIAYLLVKTIKKTKKDKEIIEWANWLTFLK